MIKDKIKFAPDYAATDADCFASVGVTVKGLTPERIWRNLINFTEWPRFDKSIIDINFEDSAQIDPHLFDKAEFYYDTQSEKRVRCFVICETHPKDDRSGRLAYRGTAFDRDGKEIYTMVVEFLVGVPGKDGDFALDAAISIKGDKAPKDVGLIGSRLMGALADLAEYAKKHD